MTSFRLMALGRILTGVSIAGIGLTHFLLPGFRSILAPLPPATVWPWAGYLTGAVLTGAGFAIALNKVTTVLSLGLALFLFLFLVLGHFPVRIKNHPEILAYWTDSVKLLGMIGGVMILSMTTQVSESSRPTSRLQNISQTGKYFFSIMLLVFGIDHFIYVSHVHKMIPSWIPFPVFWTYFTGLALIGSGISIVIKKAMIKIQILLAVMLLSWLIILHIPSILQNPFGDGALFISSLLCMQACGVALLLVATDMRTSLTHANTNH